MIVKLKKAFGKKTIFVIICLAAFLLNLYSLSLHFSANLLSSNNLSIGATLTWFSSIIIFFLSVYFFSGGKKTGGNNNRLTLSEKIIITAFFLMALILRLYRIKFQPLFFDEAFWIENAKGIIEGIVRSPFGFIGDQPSNMPAYIVALFLGIFKDSYLAVRLPGVLYSLLNILIIYIFLKETLNKKTAIIAVALLSTSIWDIHMSQWGWNNVNLNPFLISGTLVFLYLGLKKLSRRYILLAAVFLGISLNLLYVAMLNTLAVGMFFLHQLIFNKARKEVILLFVIYSLTAFMVFSPTLAKIYNYPSQSIGRHKNFTNENFDKSKNGGGFFYYIDQFILGLDDHLYTRNKYDIPGLWGITIEPVITFCFIIGLLITVFGFRQYPQMLIILLNWMVMFIPIVVLNRTTSVWREYGFLPSIFILAAFGAYFVITSLIEPINNLLRGLNINPQKMHINGTIYMLFIIAYLINWTNYFNLYRNNNLFTHRRIYEDYCSQTAESLKNIISADIQILLPQEDCAWLIRMAIPNKYQYQTYNNFQDLIPILQSGKKSAIVKISEAVTRSASGKKIDLSRFESDIRHYNQQYKTTMVRDTNYIFSYILSNY